MTVPKDKPDPSDIPEFDRVMRGLVGVDPAEVDQCPKGGTHERVQGSCQPDGQHDSDVCAKCGEILP